MTPLRRPAVAEQPSSAAPDPKGDPMARTAGLRACRHTP